MIFPYVTIVCPISNNSYEQILVRFSVWISKLEAMQWSLQETRAFEGSMKCWRWSRPKSQKYELREAKNITWNISESIVTFDMVFLTEVNLEKENILKVLLSILVGISRGWRRSNFTAFYPPIPATYCLLLSITALKSCHDFLP